MKISFDPTWSIAQIGEKKLIETVLRPLFAPPDGDEIIGDDCAALSVPEGALALLSTDRVPADLMAYKAGLLDARGLGRYLALLNLSDIAACGGLPLALLFNCALPANFSLHALVDIATGMRDLTAQFGAIVAGGDLSSSVEISLSATAFGYVEKELRLPRRGASPDDTIFVTRPPGLTTVGLRYCKSPSDFDWLSLQEVDRLRNQFSCLEPEFEIGRTLAASGHCTSCMDNTDGVGQSLSELAAESRSAFVVRVDELPLDPLVVRSAEKSDEDPIALALGPGADFGLIGTLAGKWDQERARTLHPRIVPVGSVAEGQGVHLSRDGTDEPFSPRGWEYFSSG
ncbi:thiamine-phosphate kinase [Bradyrhizobium sp. INPA03-11B]|uniref:thiamine-phosphate kinase n=1 Tax=Bradyrhizobium sp. INPA03-11B TaxID=418598 RepID=UPI00338DC30D